jgi:hypothetical protein
MTPSSRPRTSAAVIGAALLAEVVVYLGVLFAYSVAGNPPSRSAAASSPRCAQRRSILTILPFFPRRGQVCRGAFPN